MRIATLRLAEVHVIVCEFGRLLPIALVPLEITVGVDR